MTDTREPLAAPDVEAVRADARDALIAVTHATRDLDATTLAAPSTLPGWSRSHVLAHVTAIGEAMARQAERAAHGELVEVYDGGAAGREAGIQDGARRTVDEHVAALDALADRLDAAWPAPGAAGWDAPVTYRDGTVTDTLVAWWREVRIHAVDLDAGIGLDAWPPALGHHLLDFLGVRLAEDVTVELTGPTPPDDAGDATREARLVVGPTGPREATRASDPSGSSADAPVTVTGTLTDVAAWLAGRTPVAAPAARRAGEPATLPEIGPWPSPYSPPK